MYGMRRAEEGQGCSLGFLSVLGTASCDRAIRLQLRLAVLTFAASTTVLSLRTSLRRGAARRLRLRMRSAVIAAKMNNDIC